MFPPGLFSMTPMEQLIALARTQGFKDVTRVTAKCGRCHASVLANVGIAHEPSCDHPERIEFKHVDSLMDRVVGRKPKARK